MDLEYGPEYADFRTEVEAFLADTPADIDRHHRQGLVHGHLSLAEPGDAGSVAQRFSQCRTQHQHGVFNRVVGINLKITFGFDHQVKSTVLGQLGQHVIKEWNTCFNGAAAGAIEN